MRRTIPVRPPTNSTGSRDAGFTLVELVVAIAILGIISAALVGVVIQYFKVSVSTESRLKESSDIQFVSTYWQRDVSSLGVRDFTPSDTVTPVPSKQSIWVGVADPGGCTTAGSQPIVSFAWSGYTIGAANSDDAWTTTTNRVAYVALADGNQYTVERVWCGAGSVPTLTVARNVTSWSVTCDGGACGSTLPNVVQLKLHVQDASNPGTTGPPNTHNITLTGERRQA